MFGMVVLMSGMKKFFVRRTVFMSIKLEAQASANRIHRTDGAHKQNASRVLQVHQREAKRVLGRAGISCENFDCG